MLRDYWVRWISFPISLQNESGCHCHCMKEKDSLSTLRDFSKGKLIEFWYPRMLCICESQELIFLTLSTFDHFFNRIDSSVASLVSRVPTCPSRRGSEEGTDMLPWELVPGFWPFSVPALAPLYFRVQITKWYPFPSNWLWSISWLFLPETTLPTLGMLCLSKLRRFLLKRKRVF